MWHCLPKCGPALQDTVTIITATPEYIIVVFVDTLIGHLWTCFDRQASWLGGAQGLEGPLC
jgi:hypothetical protein